MLRIMLKATVDRPTNGYSNDPDPSPNTVVFTTTDPNLDGVLDLYDLFLRGMGFVPPDGILGYQQDDWDDNALGDEPPYEYPQRDESPRKETPTQ